MNAVRVCMGRRVLSCTSAISLKELHLGWCRHFQEDILVRRLLTGTELLHFIELGCHKETNSVSCFMGGA